MPTKNPSRGSRYHMTLQERVSRAATLMDTTGQILHLEWPATTDGPGLEEVEVVRQMTRTLANLLNALVDGDPVTQAEQLHHLDDLFAIVPNGRTE